MVVLCFSPCLIYYLNIKDITGKKCDGLPLSIPPHNSITHLHLADTQVAESNSLRTSIIQKAHRKLCCLLQMTWNCIGM